MENKTSVSSKNLQLLIKTDVRESTIPAEDVGYLVIDNPQVYISIPAINLLIENNAAIIAVSYTHLDVYKRQELRISCNFSPSNQRS